MPIVESTMVPKNPGSLGEDRLVITDDVIAVIDGATDKSGRDYLGSTGGALAADAVAEALVTVGTVEPTAGLAAVTNRLADLRTEWGIAENDLMAPSAVAAVLLPSLRLLWRVGDVHIGIRHRDNTWAQHRGEKKIDQIVAASRAALLRCRLAVGDTIESLAADDVGRAMMLPVLRSQNSLANIDSDDPLGFGILNGRPLPARYQQVVDLTDAEEVVIASDGYLSASPSLAEAEAELANDLARDPLRIGTHAATKAPPPSAASFDDRTYLRYRF